MNKKYKDLKNEIKTDNKKIIEKILELKLIKPQTQKVKEQIQKLQQN